MKQYNKIFIIGAGAIGKALAAFLQSMGKEVVLLRGHIDNEPPRTENIQIQLPNGEVVVSEVTVSTISNYPTLSGVIVIAIKSYGNEKIATILKDKVGNTPIVVMQNGLEVESAFINNAFPEIYRCVLFTSCQHTERDTIQFKPAHDSPIGVIKGSEERLQMIIESLLNPYLVFKAATDIQPVIWMKAIINSVFNSVCPLLEADNGIFHRDERVLSIAKRIIQECITVAATAGVALNADTVLERLLLISRTSDGQLISTYQDLLHQRKTEIETLNLAIARKAEKLNNGPLVQVTRILGELVYIKSALQRSHVSPEVLS